MTAHIPEDPAPILKLSESAAVLASEETRKVSCAVYDQLATAKRLAGSEDSLSAIQRAIVFQPQSADSWIALFKRLRLNFQQTMSASEKTHHIARLDRILCTIQVDCICACESPIKQKRLCDSLALLQIDLNGVRASMEAGDKQTQMRIENVVALDKFVPNASTIAFKSQAYFMMTQDLIKLGDAAQAVAAIKNAVAIRPTFIAGWEVRSCINFTVKLLSDILASQGNIADAISALREASGQTRREDRKVGLLLRIAILAIRSNDLVQAMETVNSLLQARPELREARVLQGIIYTLQGQLPKAIKSLRTGLPDSDEDVEVTNLIAGQAKWLECAYRQKGEDKAAAFWASKK